MTMTTLGSSHSVPCLLCGLEQTPSLSEPLFLHPPSEPDSSSGQGSGPECGGVPPSRGLPTGASWRLQLLPTQLGPETLPGVYTQAAGMVSWEHLALRPPPCLLLFSSAAG